MKYYVELQHRMLLRHLEEFGLKPIPGYLFSMSAFVLLSFFLFYKTAAAAPYIYTAIAAFLITKLSNSDRVQFLKCCFSDKDYLKVRRSENAILAMPFLCMLAIKGCFVFVAILTILAMVLAAISFENKVGFVIPTPFSDRPYEFTVGFRKMYIAFVLAYGLTAIAVYVLNFNLGVFALILVFLVCMAFYSEPEDTFYVWIFSCSPQRFLYKKLLTAMLYATILCLPILLILSVFFSANILVLPIVLGVGYCYLTTTILAKYAVYPMTMTLPETILFAIGLGFPPVLLFLIPRYYRQSIIRLKNILT